MIQVYGIFVFTIRVYLWQDGEPLDYADNVTNQEFSVGEGMALELRRNSDSQHLDQHQEPMQRIVCEKLLYFVTQIVLGSIVTDVKTYGDRG